MMRRFLFSDSRRYACTENGAQDAASAGNAAVKYSFIVWRQPAQQFQPAARRLGTPASLRQPALALSAAGRRYNEWGRTKASILRSAFAR
jgi:hypothetical protein